MIRPFIIFLFVSAAHFVSVPAQAKFVPPPKPERVDFTERLHQIGIQMDLHQITVLQQFASQGNLEKQTIQVDLVKLADQYPDQAHAWIEGAIPILESSYTRSLTNESFKRTRTSFLRACLTAMAAEQNHPKMFDAFEMDATYKRYHGSAKAFYDITSIFWVYSNLVMKQMTHSGPAGMKEAAVQYKLANYKAKNDVAELSPEDEADLRAQILERINSRRPASRL